jgi:hypothetical protein
MHPTRSVLALALAGLALVAQTRVLAHGPPAGEVDAAVARALEWVERHPATPSDGGLADVVDEALLWLLLANLTPGGGEGGHHIQALAARVVALGRLPELAEETRRPAKTLLDHYHLVLALYLAERAGAPAPWRKPVVAQAQRALAASAGDHPTVRLGIAILLSRTGEPPVVPVERLLGEGAIAYVSGPGQPIKFPAWIADPRRGEVRMLLYALVHEVVTLTEFGRDPLPPWVAARREAVAQVVRDGIAWVSFEGDYDLLAELLVAGHLLQEPWSEPRVAAIRQLLGAQKADGSWGASAATRRPNRVRHGVFTAAVALSIYGADQATAAP